MLVLERKKWERISIETPQGVILLQVCGIEGGRVRIGIDAPLEFPIRREEPQPPKEAK